jgi:acetyl/propionyl-CoA carboxylase alpha subunit
VQIIGDKHGNVRHLGTRECSVQRRYQKVFEEAPAPNLPDATRTGLHLAAVKLATAVNYDSAGTVEFVVDDETGDYFFLEMNTRLQVEHPVTEEITGIDLVEWMIAVALGAPLSAPQAHVRFRGHALEARILAEDPGAGFIPQIGTVQHIVIPDGVRWDAAVEPGSEITPHYDSMIAKLIVHDDDRESALAKMRSTLDEMIVGGIATSAGLHRWLLDQPELIDGRITTRFLDEAKLPATLAPPLAQAAALWQLHLDNETPATVWHQSPGFSLIGRRSQHALGLRVGGPGGEVHEVVPTAETQLPTMAVVDDERREISINVDGHTHFFTVATRSDRWRTDNAARAATGDALVAPFPAVVAEVHVAPGDAVTGDQVLVVIEAMKMLHSLKSSGAATVDQVPVAVGDQVTTNQPLVTFQEQP